MQSHQKEKSPSKHFIHGTTNLFVAAVSSTLDATLARLNRDDSWFRNNNSDISNAFLTTAVYLFGVLAVVNMGGVAYNYGLGIFKAIPCKRCKRNNQTLDNDLEAPLQPR